MIEVTPFLMGFLALSLCRSLVQVYLDRLNLSFLRQHLSRIPGELRETVNPEKWRMILDYTLDSNRFSLCATLMSDGIFLVLLLLGFFPWLDKRIQGWDWGLTLSGMAFFGILAALANLLRIPMGLYETFVIEARYGFNTLTAKTWVIDLVKGLALFTLLGGLFLWLLLSVIAYGGRMWWVWAWLFVGGFELLLLWLFPVVMAPLFNKFEPITDNALKHHIRSLMEDAGLQVRDVFKMDASKRSKHTNAFFTGVGRTKRIVLFDTLLQSHPEEEILAVIAHEAGHWKRKHILRELVLMETVSLVLFYGFSQCLAWPSLFKAFGFDEPRAYIGLFLIGACLSPLSYFVQPVAGALSRRFEREADDFSLKLMKTPEPLCHALKRMARDNLENVNPHPLYAWFYFSHPPLMERIQRLENYP